MHPKTTLNPWAIALLATVCFLFLAADSVGPHVPSVFSRIVSTNKTADAWRGALSVPSAASLTTVSNAQVATAADLVTVSNALDNTASDLVTVSNALATKPTVALTNVALLSGTNVFTGTNTFSTNTIIGTNAVDSFISVGSRWRTIYQSGPTNFSPPGPSTAATQLVATVTLPPLLSPLSVITVAHRIWRTNAASEPVWTVEWRANATNGPLVAAYTPLGSGAYQTTLTGLGAGNMLPIINCSSHTEQWVQGNNSITATEPVSLGWNTLATTNVLYLQLINTSATGTSAVNFASTSVRELY